MSKLSSAREYARRGFSVLPVHGKRPLIKFADQAPLTEEQINDYWTIWPNANIALRTIDFFVVDIDTKTAHGQDGLTSAEELKKDGLLIPTLEQCTASGGRQLFYKQVKPGTDRQIIALKPGIDIKGKTNNYVVVPPSTIGKGQYHWIDNTAKLQQPPTGLVELIKNYQPPTRSETPYGNNSASKKWTGIVLDTITSGAPQGQRNDHLTRLCGQMLYAGAESETVWELLNFANNFNEPPLPSNEVSHIMESILKRELRS